jgi:hypothetical protein
MTSWYQLWQKREAAARRLLSLDRELAATPEPGDQLAVHDLGDPLCKRLLFDDSSRVTQQTSFSLEGASARYLRPNLANELVWACGRLRPCAPTCDCV